MKNVNKLAFLGATISFALFLSGTALADSALLVSGPTGPQTNGWYTSHPTVKVQAVCNGAPYGNQFDMDIAGWSWSGGGNPEQANPGRHYVKVLSNSNSNMYLENDGTLSPYLAGGCSNPDGSQPTTVLWEGYVQWDNTSPVVSLSGPQNNTNTAADNVQVTGTVSDTGSGVQSVTVNGHAAAISGNTFSVNLPLTIGLNAITATATDNAGHQSQSNQLTVFRYEDKKSASGGTSPTPSAPTSNQNQPSQNQNASGSDNGKQDEQKKPQNVVQQAEQLPTPVKAAGGAGVGLGVLSALGYVPYKKIGAFIVKAVSK